MNNKNNENTDQRTSAPNTKTTLRGQDQRRNRSDFGRETEDNQLLDSQNQEGHGDKIANADQTGQREGYCFDARGHLHRLDGKPLTGTTSVVDVLARPLHWWALGIGLGELGWTKIKDPKTGKPFPMETRVEKAAVALQSLQNMTPKDYLALLDKAYYAHQKSRDKSATAGTDRHEMCARYIRIKMRPEKTDFDYIPIQSFIDWAEKNVTKWLWSEMHVYSRKHWVGGISDAGGIDKQGKLFIIDFKSAKEAYMSNFAQIGGYDLQLSENDGGFTAEGSRILTLDGKRPDYYIVFPFGAEKPQPVFYHNPADMQKFFINCLEIYRMLPTNY
jgi:hypothetical protein